MAVPQPICVMQPILPAAITCGFGRFDIAHLALLRRVRDLRLEQIVGAGRPAAQMAFRHFRDLRNRPGSAAIVGAGLDLLPCCIEQAE